MDSPITLPSDRLDSVAAEAGAGPETHALATAIVGAVNTEQYCVGKRPSAVAAACVYVAGLVTNDRVRQEDFDSVSAVGLRDHYRNVARLAADAPGAGFTDYERRSLKAIGRQSTGRYRDGGGRGVE